MVSTELGACEWFVWDLRRSNLLDRGQLDQVVGEFLEKNPRAEPPALAEPDVAAGVDVLDEDDELQAAAVNTRPAARAARPARRKERELQAPVDLLPTLNPHIPSF